MGTAYLVSSWRKLRKIQLIFSLSLSLSSLSSTGDLVILGMERGGELADFESIECRNFEIFTLEKGRDFSNRFNRYLSTWFSHKHYI